MAVRGRKPRYLDPVRCTVITERSVFDIISLIATPIEIWNLGISALLEGRSGELPVYKLDRLLLMKKAELEKVKEDLILFELVYSDAVRLQEKSQLVREALKEADP